MEHPGDLKYTESDEWIRVEGNQGTVGITDYAQEQLSDIVFFEVLEGVGSNVAKGESFAAVESVKAAADVYLPVTGVILETNDALADAPELVNTDPYGAAWMVRIEVTDDSELAALMDAVAYEKYCEERDH